MTARQLVWTYADREITKIVSSPVPRCVETVVPLAASLGLAVDQHWELSPDSDLDDVLTLLIDLPDTTLACTHREVGEKLLGWETPFEKGAAWVLERRDRELVPALYLDAPAVARAGQRQPA
jgi:broad specificity phosphatase PhoE